MFNHLLEGNDAQVSKPLCDHDAMDRMSLFLDAGLGFVGTRRIIPEVDSRRSCEHYQGCLQYRERLG